MSSFFFVWSVGESSFGTNSVSNTHMSYNTLFLFRPPNTKDYVGEIVQNANFERGVGGLIWNSLNHIWWSKWKAYTVLEHYICYYFNSCPPNTIKYFPESHELWFVSPGGSNGFFFTDNSRVCRVWLVRSNLSKSLRYTTTFC